MAQGEERWDDQEDGDYDEVKHVEDFVALPSIDQIMIVIIVVDAQKNCYCDRVGQDQDWKTDCDDDLHVSGLIQLVLIDFSAFKRSDFGVGLKANVEN